MSERRALAIGEVIDLLHEEFPDISISKLRFLESQGRIRPVRSPACYRQFRAPDVERIRYVLRQQRDHFLPLKVIKAKLSAWERGEEPTVPPSSGPLPEAYFGGGRVRMSTDELARAAGVPLDLIERLIEHGVLDSRRDKSGDAPFGEDDAAVARAAQRLVSRGLEPRHVKSLCLASHREVDLLSQLAGPLLRHRTPAGRRQAAEVLADCAQAARDLQDAVVRARLRTLLEG
ncbi:MAG: MerR family transcriptional regulator, partial [Gemmatimonadetes bacterium]|nr:MerR family transcriptional regulator [Gemmatimonadota bacterium]